MWIWGELISPWATLLHLTSVLSDPAAMSTQMVFHQRPDFYALSLLSSERSRNVGDVLLKTAPEFLLCRTGGAPELLLLLLLLC